jgi:hypothetical protein
VLDFGDSVSEPPLKRARIESAASGWSGSGSGSGSGDGKAAFDSASASGAFPSASSESKGETKGDGKRDSKSASVPMDEEIEEFEELDTGSSFGYSASRCNLAFAASVVCSSSLAVCLAVVAALAAAATAAHRPPRLHTWARSLRPAQPLRTTRLRRRLLA